MAYIKKADRKVNFAPVSMKLRILISCYAGLYFAFY